MTTKKTTPQKTTKTACPPKTVPTKAQKPERKPPSLNARIIASSAAIRRATLADADSIKDLVQLYASRNEMLPRSLNEIYENIRDYAVVEHDGKIIACGGLHICWVDLAEVKALAVLPRYVGTGLGTRIVNHLREEARAIGVTKLFCLTYKEGFFKKCGFKRVDVNDLPKKVWVECVRCIYYPNCNEIAMVQDL